MNTDKMHGVLVVNVNDLAFHQLGADHDHVCCSLGNTRQGSC